MSTSPITSGAATYASRTHVLRRSKTGMVEVPAKTKGPIDTESKVTGYGLHVLHLPTGGQRTDASVDREACPRCNVFSCFPGNLFGQAYVFKAALFPMRLRVSSSR